METKVCIRCNTERPIKSFPTQSRDRAKRRNVCGMCKYQREVDSGYREATKEKRREYYKTYHKNNPEVARYKSLVSYDKGKGYTSMSLNQYRELIKAPCHYCGNTSNISADRKDCSAGHELNNCVPCCEKCNFILGDLPQEAKEIMKYSLSEVFNQGLLENWVIPVKRRSN